MDEDKIRVRTRRCTVQINIRDHPTDQDLGPKLEAATRLAHRAARGLSDNVTTSVLGSLVVNDDGEIMTKEPLDKVIEVAFPLPGNELCQDDPVPPEPEDGWAAVFQRKLNVLGDKFSIEYRVVDSWERDTVIDLERKFENGLEVIGAEDDEPGGNLT